jgi:hypothetical protein
MLLYRIALSTQFYRELGEVKKGPGPNDPLTTVVGKLPLEYSPHTFPVQEMDVFTSIELNSNNILNMLKLERQLLMVIAHAEHRGLTINNGSIPFFASALCTYRENIIAAVRVLCLINAIQIGDGTDRFYITEEGKVLLQVMDAKMPLLHPEAEKHVAGAVADTLNEQCPKDQDNG